MTTTASTRVLLASAVNLRYYKASFGGGNSQLGGKEEFCYDPHSEMFMVRHKAEILMGAWQTVRYPCPLGQAKALLGRLLQVHEERAVPFSYRGWLCRLDLETCRFDSELRIQYYVGSQASGFVLSPRLTARLLMVAKGPKWLAFVDELAA
jgi:hypothetical protein